MHILNDVNNGLICLYMILYITILGKLDLLLDGLMIVESLKENRSNHISF